MSKKNIIKVGYLLSYDYCYIFTSLKHIYEHADRIVISYDANNKTWAGNDIHIPESVFSDIKKLDTQNKIIFYKDTFFIEGMQPMELETRQRNMMAEKMGAGGWHIQMDGDEYAYDFGVLAGFLKGNKFLLKNPAKNPFNFQVNFVTLFKHNAEGFFVITPFDEKCMLITNNPQYEYARNTNKGRILPLDFYLIHQSWAREESEISEKINNWGHKNDFDTSTFLNSWKTVNADNYKIFIDFHPLYKGIWKELSFFPAKNIDEFILSFSKKYPQQKLNLNLSFTKKIKMRIKSLF
ncbi:hypothetical protein [Chryseobacterium aquifrigidense]|uniref:Glycosyl transferase family 2 n=1 Tax=Chryseobacterium aquifrigidense TaxID=558021 RepID=A0A543DTE1_9FLAO|nr:hypothetical protein [Chryseobacterium aquifrigidense]TQM12594.1 hypothetical protein FB551_4713 [Chryseobacterium aquifrigidense]